MLWLTSVTINYEDANTWDELKVDVPDWEVTSLIRQIANRKPRPTSLVLTMVWREHTKPPLWP